MKTLLTMALVLIMAGSAFAQLDNSIGVFFDATDLSEANTNFDPAASAPFSGYIALLAPTQQSVGGYEVSLAIPATVLALSVTGPNGWTNFGDNFNHLAGYQTPLPTLEGTVLCTYSFLSLDGGAGEMFMGPSEPSSVGGEGPAIADGANPDDLFVCNYTSGPDEGGLVATLHGLGITFPDVVATQNASLSGVKALFE